MGELEIDLIRVVRWTSGLPERGVWRNDQRCENGKTLCLQREHARERRREHRRQERGRGPLKKVEGPTPDGSPAKAQTGNEPKKLTISYSIHSFLLATAEGALDQ